MPDKKITDSEESVPFYPDQVHRELWVAGVVIIALLAVGLLGMIYPVGLGEPANAMHTPAHVKPEWYFLALYQLLKFIPKTIGAILPVIAVLLLALLPFIDRQPDRNSRGWRGRLAVVVATLSTIIALTIWGEVS